MESIEFGEVLRRLLEDNDITQRQLATDLNMGATTIGNYIRGIRQPDFDTLKLFADYFNVTTDYLLDYQSGITKEHGEDELLRIYRSLPPDKRQLLIEEGKLLVRFNIKAMQK